MSGNGKSLHTMYNSTDMILDGEGKKIEHLERKRIFL
jgi:hypothetical protein